VVVPTSLQPPGVGTRPDDAAAPNSSPFVGEPTAAPSGSRATYFAYRLGGVAARMVPSSLGEPMARGIGRALAVAMRGRRTMIARHLQRAAGGTYDERQLDRAVVGAFDSYARYWLEMFRLPHEATRAIEQNFTVDGYEHIEAALAAGKGAIAALPHLGGWEWAGAWMAKVKGQCMLVVVEPVEPRELFEWFVEVRSAMGMEVVALGDDTAARVTRALKENRVVCLVSDRDLTGDGVEVEFFAERTSLPAGAATLALRTGAPILPVAVYFGRGRRHHGVVRPPLDTRRGEGRLRADVERITQDLAREFEHLIRTAPEQWHLMQPNWPSDYEFLGLSGAEPE
jgi:phosphatidylinositol dimannoside acyltransferase